MTLYFFFVVLARPRERGRSSVRSGAVRCWCCTVLGSPDRDTCRWLTFTAEGLCGPPGQTGRFVFSRSVTGSNARVEQAVVVVLCDRRLSSDVRTLLYQDVSARRRERVRVLRRFSFSGGHASRSIQ